MNNLLLNEDREFNFKKKSKGIAYLLWFFLGLYGGHRYYMGDIGIGIAMTLTGGGVGVWTLIDAFYIGKRIDSINRNLELKREQDIWLWNQKREQGIRLQHQRREQESRLLYEERIRRSGIREVDTMTGEAFERFLQILLQSRGYKVSTTPTTGDYGADLILSTDNKIIAVQAKRYNSKVGLSAVQEIVSAKSYYGANECWVITNNFFTAQAVKLATSNDVMLIDREKLIEWMVVEDKGV